MLSLSKIWKLLFLIIGLFFFLSNTGRDGTIESSTFIIFYNTKFWAERCEDVKNDLNIRKKYTFQVHV